MKWILLLLIPFFFFLPIEGKSLPVKLRAESAILINADTGAILYEKNARRQLFPASITKIATALYALHARGDKLDKMVTAERECLASVSVAEVLRSNYELPSHWLTHDATHIGIKNGEILSLKDLIYGTMLASGGDASNMIAHYIGGTIPKFMQLLNDYMQEIGCKNTHFKNPHGLHHPHHYTTAYDMAIMTREAFKYPAFKEVVKTVRYQRPKTNKQGASTIAQGNRLLVKGKHYYPKAIGVKTGFHSHAQYTIVAAAQDGDRTLIAVLMKTKNRDERYEDAKKLFEAAFNEKKVSKKLLAAGNQKAVLSIPKASRPIITYTKNPVCYEYYPSEESQLSCKVRWEEVTLPVKKNDYVGSLCFQDPTGKILFTEPLFAYQDVNEKRMLRFKAFLAAHPLIKIGAILAALLAIGGLVIVLARRR